MHDQEKWTLTDGYCEVQNGQILYHKTKSQRREKIISFEISNLISLEKELKYEWVILVFDSNGRKVKKEFTFKNQEDADAFINSTLEHSPAGKFDDQAKEIDFYNAIRRPLSIFLYAALFILCLMAIAYGIDYFMQVLDVDTVRVSALLLLLMNIVWNHPMSDDSRRNWADLPARRNGSGCETATGANCNGKKVSVILNHRPQQ